MPTPLIVVGANRTVGRSDDGITWVAVSSVGLVDSFTSIYAVTGGGSVAVAGGDVDDGWYGAGVVTTDNDNWSYMDMQHGWITEALAYSPTLGLFLSVATGGGLSTSPDGVNWTWGDLGFGGSSAFGDAIWASGLDLFVACASSGSTWKVATSPDGVTWTDRTAGITVPSGGLYSLGYSADLGLLVTGGQLGGLWTSPDGITWTSRTSPFAATSAVVNDVTWSPALGLFVAVGGGGKLATSPDGVTWTLRTSSFSSSTINGVEWFADAGVFVACGSTGKIATSPDGTTWTQRSNPFGSNDLYDISLGAAILPVGGYLGLGGHLPA